VIPHYHVGEDGGIPYLAMRFVAGDDGRALVRREGPIEPQRAARIVAQVAGALDAAHAAGLVHRDVKPANVLLGPDDHAYLSDFGLSRRVRSISGVTATGQWVGTLDYVAPEQIRGGAIDARTGVYALGGVLYSCSPARSRSRARATRPGCGRTSRSRRRARASTARRRRSRRSSGARSRSRPTTAIRRPAISGSTAEAARVAGNAARAVAAGLGSAPAVEPPPLYAVDPGTGRLAISTPSYNTAVVPVSQGAFPYGGSSWRGCSTGARTRSPTSAGGRPRRSAWWCATGPATACSSRSSRGLGSGVVRCDSRGRPVASAPRSRRGGPSPARSATCGQPARRVPERSAPALAIASPPAGSRRAGRCTARRGPALRRRPVPELGPRRARRRAAARRLADRDRVPARLAARGRAAVREQRLPHHAADGSGGRDGATSDRCAAVVGSAPRPTLAVRILRRGGAGRAAMASRIQTGRHGDATGAQ
jgi:hypothetical protein